MCEPVSIIAGVGAAVSLTSGIIGAVGAKNKAEYEAALKRQQAYISEVQGGRAEYNAQLKSGVYRERGSRAVGQITAHAAGSNLALVGSVVDMAQATATFSEYDAQVAKHEGIMKRWGYQVDAAMGRASANLTEDAGTYNMWGSLLGGAGGALSSVSRMSFGGAVGAGLSEGVGVQGEVIPGSVAAAGEGIRFS